MAKKVVRINQAQSQPHELALSHIKREMDGRCACCVIITCSKSSRDGKMEVEMSFEGEESLAAFLIENASQVFDERIAERESRYT